MNLLSFAMTGMVHTPGAGGDAKGGGGGGVPPGETEIAIETDAATGKPSAKPDSAWVSPNGTIIWTSAEPFEIILKLLWTNERVSKKSGKTGDKHELKVTAGAINGRYSYGIKVGDQEVDPDVIIGPKQQNQ